jgi:hypothetical protein
MFHSPPSLRHPRPYRGNLGIGWVRNHTPHSGNVNSPGPQTPYGDQQYGNYHHQQDSHHMAQPSAVPGDHRPLADSVPDWLAGIPDGPQASSISPMAALSSSPQEFFPRSGLASASEWAPSPSQVPPMDEMSAAEYNPWATPALPSTVPLYGQDYTAGFVTSPYAYPGTDSSPFITQPPFPQPPSGTPHHTQAPLFFLPSDSEPSPAVANGSTPGLHTGSDFDPSVYPPVHSQTVSQTVSQTSSDTDSDGLGFGMYQPDYLGLTLCPSHPRQEAPVARPQSCIPGFGIVSEREEVSHFYREYY